LFWSSCVKCGFFQAEKKPLSTNPIIAAALVAALSGCSSTEVVRAPLEVSIGQQLIDLKKARDNGVLSASEYDSQRRRLIDNVQ
jgi:hypothetical protein